MTFGAIFVLLEVVSIPCRLGFDMRAVSLPLPVAVSSSTLPLPISLGTICDHAVPLLWRPMGVVVAMDPFFSSSRIVGFILRGAVVMVVAVPVTLPSVAAVASLPSPLLGLRTIAVVISAPAVMRVVPPAPAVASLPALSVPVTVSVMLPGVAFVIRLQMSNLRSPHGLVNAPGLYHKRPIQMSLHVGVQVEGGGHPAALLWVKLVEQGLAAGPHVVSPQLVGPLLPHGHGLRGPLLLFTAHTDQTERKSSHDNGNVNASHAVCAAQITGMLLSKTWFSVSSIEAPPSQFLCRKIQTQYRDNYRKLTLGLCSTT